MNPDAEAIAAALDRERKERASRGPLHGIPILIKDNIDTADRMMTTAGSLALVGRETAQDAFVAKKLRDAGAVILGKQISASGPTFARLIRRVAGVAAADKQESIRARP